MSVPVLPGTLSVDAIRDVPPAQVDPGAFRAVADERAALRNEQFKIRNDLLKTEVDDRRQDRRERLTYAGRIYGLVVAWLMWMGFVVLAQGFHLGRFSLADPVIIALVGGTTATVIGIFLIVANYLFPKSSPTRSSDDATDQR